MSAIEIGTEIGNLTSKGGRMQPPGAHRASEGAMTKFKQQPNANFNVA